MGISSIAATCNAATAPAATAATAAAADSSPPALAASNATSTTDVLEYEFWCTAALEHCRLRAGSSRTCKESGCKSYKSLA